MNVVFSYLLHVARSFFTMSSSRLLQVLARRSFSVSSRVAKDEIHPGYSKLKEIQAHFQKEDGRPIHLKGGPLDGILYRSTVLLTLTAFGMALYDIYLLSTKK